ncbi:MAG: ComF family protein [Kiritimatiellaeota bacterium]|nr:ComF family protein [Kiritimatiellota bacterium]
MNRIVWLFLDLIYPRRCPGCQTPSDRENRHWCWDCFQTIEPFPLHGGCDLCGQRVEGNVTHSFVCGACQSDRPQFDRARAAADFSGSLREQILAFKYHHALWMRQDLCDVLEGTVRTFFHPAVIDVVMPVPLYRLRQRERTYNQSALLAEELARRLGRRLDTQSLARVRETRTQTRLNAAHRRTNVAGAFQVKRPEWVAQRCVLLVDDVMTTGATLDECARVLKKAGARTVWAATLARRKS